MLIFLLVGLHFFRWVIQPKTDRLSGKRKILQAPRSTRLITLRTSSYGVREAMGNLLGKFRIRNFLIAFIFIF